METRKCEDGWRNCEDEDDEKKNSLPTRFQSHSHSRLESIFFSLGLQNKAGRLIFFQPPSLLTRRYSANDLNKSSVEEAQEKKASRSTERYKLSLILKLFSFKMMMWGWYKFFNMCHTHLFSLISLPHFSQYHQISSSKKIILWIYVRRNIFTFLRGEKIILPFKKFISFLIQTKKIEINRWPVALFKISNSFLGWMLQ